MTVNQPFFSIVIATYNRTNGLRDCLESLEKQEYPKERFEVIVVDDGSLTPADEVVNLFSKKINIELIKQQNSGCGVARNNGAEKAKGQYIAFTDDDCTHPPNWLSGLEKRFLQAPKAMIGGRSINVLNKNIYSHSSQLLVDYLFNFFNSDPNNALYLNSIALPREAFLLLGKFDITFFMSAEDRDLCDRWLLSGNKIIYAPEIIIYHAHHLTLKSFWKQHFSYGRGAYWFYKIHITRWPQAKARQPFSFYLNLILYPLKQSTLLQFPIVMFLFFLSQIATILGRIQEKYQNQ